VKEQTLSVSYPRQCWQTCKTSRSGVGTSASCLGVSGCEIRPESAYRQLGFSWLSFCPGKRHNLDNDSEARPASYSVGTEVLSRVIKPAPSAEIKNGWSCIVFPLYTLMVWAGTTSHLLHISCKSSSVFPRYRPSYNISTLQRC